MSKGNILEGKIENNCILITIIKFDLRVPVLTFYPYEGLKDIMSAAYPPPPQINVMSYSLKPVRN